MQFCVQEGLLTCTIDAAALQHSIDTRRHAAVLLATPGFTTGLILRPTELLLNLVLFILTHPAIDIG